MSKKAVLALLSVVAIAAVYAAVASRGPHEFSKRQCPRCHVDAEKAPLELTSPVTSLCRKCHEDVVLGSSHPFDVAPKSMRVPEDLPLRDGKVTCSTCHNMHAESQSLFGVDTHFLRRPTSDMRFFCASCHKENPLRPGHLLIMAAHEANSYSVTAPDEPIDELSLTCIGCHDGDLASAAKYSIGRGVWQHAESSHPVGVDYNMSMMRRGGLAPPSGLDPRVRLFDGRVGCGTCHDMFSSLPGKLVMSNERSRLCRDCHYDK